MNPRTFTNRYGDVTVTFQETADGDPLWFSIGKSKTGVSHYSRDDAIDMARWLAEHFGFSIETKKTCKLASTHKDVK